MHNITAEHCGNLQLLSHFPSFLSHFYPSVPLHLPNPYNYLLVLCRRCCAGASHCSGLSCCRAQAPDLLASVVAVRGLTSCSWWTQSLDAEAVPWASLLCNMCSRPRPGTSLVSSALAGGLLLPVPPGKPSVPS